LINGFAQTTLESPDKINERKRMMLRSSSVPTIGEAVQSTTFARKKSAPIHTTATLNATKTKNVNEQNLNAAWAAFRNQNDIKQGSGVVED
jgi:hypothetical protein